MLIWKEVSTSKWEYGGLLELSLSSPFVYWCGHKNYWPLGCAKLCPSLIQNATEFDFQHTFTHRQNLLKVNDGCFQFRFEGNRRRLAHGTLWWGESCLWQNQLVSMHADAICCNLRDKVWLLWTVNCESSRVSPAWDSTPLSMPMDLLWDSGRLWGLKVEGPKSPISWYGWYDKRA